MGEPLLRNGVRNGERDEKFQKFQKGFDAFKLEVVEQYSKLHDMITSRFQRADQEESNGKGILGSTLVGFFGTPGQHGQSSSSQNVTLDTSYKPPKLVLPKFDGIYPKAWIRTCERFFLIHPVAPKRRFYLLQYILKRKQIPFFSPIML